MKDKTIISFSFDDGRKDNIDLAKGYLLSKNIPATFNITTGYIDGTAPNCIKANVEPMSIDDVRWLNSQKIFEIALHSDKHKNDAKDVERGRVKLCDWLNLPKNTQFGFASPHSSFSLTNYDKYFDTDKITYVRIGDNQSGKSFLKAKEKMSKIRQKISEKSFLSRLLNRYIDTPFFIKRYACLLVKDSMIDAIDGKIIYSIPIFRGDKPETVNNYVKFAIRNNLSLVLMFHSVSEVNNDNIYNYMTSDFIKICENLISLVDKKKCEIATVKELYDVKRKRASV